MASWQIPWNDYQKLFGYPWVERAYMIEYIVRKIIQLLLSEKRSFPDYRPVGTRPRLRGRGPVGTHTFIWVRPGGTRLRLRRRGPVGLDQRERNYFQFELQQSLPLLLGGTAFLGGIEFSTARISSLYR